MCLFVYDYSRTTGYVAAYERYKQLQCYKGMKNNAALGTATAPVTENEIMLNDEISYLFLFSLLNIMILMQTTCHAI